MNVNKSTLIQTLTKLKPGLAHRNISVEDVCFHFHNDTIVTYNSNIFVSIPFNSQIEGGVRAEELYKLLTKMPEEVLELSVENNEFRVTCGKVKAGIALEEVRHPEIEPTGEWKDFSPELAQAINLAVFSVSKNLTRPQFTCVHVNENLVISSDGYRVTRFQLAEKSPFNFLLPGFAAKHINTEHFSFSKILVDENWIYLTDDGRLLFAVRKLEGELFTDEQIDRFIHVDGPSVVLPPLEATLERCKLMAPDEVSFETSVELSFMPEKLKCKGQKELGWVEEEVDIAYDGRPFKIQINPTFLTDIIKLTSRMTVGEKCLFEGPNLKHVVVLAEE